MNLEEVFSLIDDARSAPPESDLAPDEVTLNMYAAARPALARSTCERALLKALAQGKLERRPASVGGRRCWAYRAVKSTP
jgi:hypothetical protein